MSVENSNSKNDKERYSRYRQRYLNKSAETVSKYLQKLEELPGEPDELAYFKNILRKVFIDNKVIRYADNEIFVGSFCATMPAEIIRAAGARPIKLCSNSFVGAYIGDYTMPRDLCPLVKSVVGNITGEISEMYNACSMYIVPISCDCKKMLASRLSDVKPTVPLYLPLNRTDDDGMDTYIKELKKVADRISEITGVKATRESLASQIKLQEDVQRDIRVFLSLKNDTDILIRGSHALAVMNSLAYDDIAHWGRHLKKLNEELLEKKNKKEYLTKKKLPRILLAGSPITFPNMKIPLIVEEQGGIIAADETCLGDKGISDLVSICDNTANGFYRALANRYIKPCSCPIFPDSDIRIRKMEKTVKDAHIDGIVYHVLRGCVVYDYEFEQIEKYFSARGIPVIRLESDFSDEDVEQLRVRIEAFIEMLAFKKN